MNEKRQLSSQDKAYLLSLKPDDITLELLNELFTDRYDSVKKKPIQSRYNTYDEFTLDKGDYFNKEKIVTNCGLFIYNKYVIEKDLKDVVGYVNEPLTKKQIGKVASKLDDALLEDKITTDIYINYLNRLTWLAFTFNSQVCTSLTVKSMTELPVVKEEKKKLIKKYEKQLENHDAPTAVKMEEELIQVARNAMKDDPVMDLYDSGARGAFGVAYKNSQIMKGPVYNESKKRFDIMTEPLAGGITKGDVPTLANSIISNAYNKSIAPGECGYLTKKISAALQSAELDKKGTDCGTKGLAEVELTEENLTFYKYGFIVEGSKTVRLEPSNYSKYLGKKVKMRSSDFCIGKKICNKCAGDRYYMIGISKVGLTAPRISNSMLNGRMKQAHDSTVHTFELNMDDFV